MFSCVNKISINRLSTILLVASAWLLSIEFAIAENKLESRPNVLFIAVDDLRPELGCYGVNHVKSPHIDSLATQGVLFERAYCQQAVCNPSRASVMTGRRPDSLQVWDLGTDFRQTVPNAVTIPQHLAGHGYRTACIGKIFHNIFPDEVSWTDPILYVDGFPFDPDAVYAGQQQLAWLEQRKSALIAAGKDSERIDQFGHWYLKAAATESPDVDDSAYYDGAQTDMAIKKLAELAADERPFFFGVGYYRPHLPFNAPKKYWDLYDRQTIPLASHPDMTDRAPPMAINNMRELRGYYDFANSPRPENGTLTEDQQRLLKHGYLASVSYVDAQIGRLLAQLEDLGIRDNTIVVLWSDHGWKLGEHNSWCKMTNYEIDTRVPLIISCPGSAHRGEKCQGMVELVDLFPTLCDLTHVPQAAELEGTSFSDLLGNPQGDGKPVVYHQFLREGGWVAPDGVEYMGYAVRTEHHRYVRWVNWPEKRFAADELFDLDDDPGEVKNIVSDPANRILKESMRGLLAKGFKATGDLTTDVNATVK